MVSAAHCIHEKYSSGVREAFNAVLYVGKNNLENNLELRYEKVGVKRIFVHQDWQTNEATFDADIAVFVLNRKINFTEYIRPICLWNLSRDLKKIENRNGTIVGWGFDESVRSFNII